MSPLQVKGEREAELKDLPFIGAGSEHKRSPYEV